MAGLNKVMLIGHLGQDPEVKTLQSGKSVAHFSMATSEKWKGQDGQWQEKTEWHRLVAWDKLADLVGQYLVKGSQVFIEGKLQTREWDDKQTGEKRKTTEIVVQSMQFLGSKNGGSGGGGQKKQDPEQYQGSTDGFGDEDIPF